MSLDASVQKLLGLNSQARQHRAGSKRNERFGATLASLGIEGAKPMADINMRWIKCFPKYKYWKVYVPRVKQRYFFFKDESDMDEALQKAVECRDALIAELGLDINKPVPKPPRTPTNVVGVFETTRQRKSGEVRYFMASWRENGQQKARLFRIDKYGREKAFELAVKMRAKHEKSGG